MKEKKKVTKVIWSASIITILALLFSACAIYVNDYYQADPAAIEAFEPASPECAITQSTLSDGTFVYSPEDPIAGFIFYPGGKVEYTAYQPLMEACASKGILCVLVEMPFNLAVLDINAADGVIAQYPEIDDWYIGGHSLGGSMAASYLADHTDDFKGLILLGSYSTADLSNSDLTALSIYGSEDLVMNREKYSANKTNLPEDFTEIVIEGGCHAYFGMYGAQDGDGTPAITPEEQIRITTDAVIALISSLQN